MSPTAPGRHRAPRQPLSARAGRLLPPSPLARGSAVAAATSGLILAFPAGASSAPAAGGDGAGEAAGDDTDSTSSPAGGNR